MNSTHTPEPWQINPDVEDTNGCLIEAESGRMICECFEGGEAHCEEDKGNARRIVACVNACAGVPIEELEKLAELKCDLPGVAGIAQLAVLNCAIQEERDQLADALRDLVEINELSTGMGMMVDRPDMNGPLPRARAVLAKLATGTPLPTE